MRVLITSINLELGENASSEAVVGNHSFDRFFHQQFGVLRADFLHGAGFDATDIAGVGVIPFQRLLVPGFPSGSECVNLR